MGAGSASGAAAWAPHPSFRPARPAGAVTARVEGDGGPARGSTATLHFVLSRTVQSEICPPGPAQHSGVPRRGGRRRRRRRRLRGVRACTSWPPAPAAKRRRRCARQRPTPASTGRVRRRRATLASRWRRRRRRRSTPACRHAQRRRGTTLSPVTNGSRACATHGSGRRRTPEPVRAHREHRARTGR